MARTILLADDSVTAQNMGRRILTDAGYEVITVNNGSAALKKIAEHKPDLIVLDVYMPGYGGLEVCNRLKEARETARIPVLLTVGKLEPFKPDEARKARADAFLVKPFEASELLTALTKLEDKIVPQAQPHKPGRFAKALASIEAGETDETFGNVETGWKDRLKIPPTPVRTRAVEAHAEEKFAPADLGRPDDFKPSEPASRFERPIPAGLPADITAEEIAAITAAAATISGKEEAAAPTTESEAVEAASRAETQSETATESVAGLTSVVETAATEEPVATLASATAETQESVASEKAEAETKVEEAIPAPIASGEASTVAESPAAEPVRAEATPPEVKSEPSEPTSEEKPWERDAEVLAAIASLVPTESQANERQESGDRGMVEVAAVAAAAGSGSSRASGPRWIAEAVALLDEDSSANLELEMEKAQASAEAASRTVLAVDVREIPAEVPSAVETAAPTVAASPEVGIAAAYAAAAATGAGIEATTVVEATMMSVAAEPAPIVEPGEKLREAEMAAAWENWKHIRETIVGEQLTSQIAEVAAAELRASEVERAEAPEIAEESADSDDDEESGESEEPEAIASIVDSVLAELKPKLVEEIARKMSKEKKGKAKKNKK